MKVERETIESSKSIDPYACAIKIKHQVFDIWLTLIFIPRKLSRHYYFFMQESGDITGQLISTTYEISAILAGGFEVPLVLTFSVKSEEKFKLMKNFVSNLYDYNYTGDKQKTTRKRAVVMKKLL